MWGIDCYQEKQNRRDCRKHTPFGHPPPCPAQPTGPPGCGLSSPARPAVTGSERGLSLPVPPQRKRRPAAPRDGVGGDGRLHVGHTNTTALRIGGSGLDRPSPQAGTGPRAPAESHTHPAAATLSGLGHVLGHLVALVKADGHGVADGHGYGARARWRRMDTDPTGFTHRAAMAPHRKGRARAGHWDGAISGGRRSRGRARDGTREIVAPSGKVGVL